ncbi:hypothetical protein ACWFMI_02060 [Nocardiopsis terrae]
MGAGDSALAGSPPGRRPRERLCQASAWRAAASPSGTTVPRPDDAAAGGVTPAAGPDPPWRIGKL